VALLAALCAAFVGLVISATRKGTRTAPRDTTPRTTHVPESRTGPLDRLQAIDVERVAKLFAGLAILLYILGLLNVNGYLFTFGVTDFNLIRTRFIYTGVLIASSAFVCALPLFILGPFRQDYRQALKAGKDELAGKLAKQAGKERRFRRWMQRALFVFLRVIAFIVWVLGSIIMLAMPILLLQLYLQQLSASDFELMTGKPETATATVARLAVALLVYLFGFLGAWNIRRATKRIRRKALKARVDDRPGIAIDVG
jgi:hypothetical protein